jgi:hypothetical protein
MVHIPDCHTSITVFLSSPRSTLDESSSSWAESHILEDMAVQSHLVAARQSRRIPAGYSLSCNPFACFTEQVDFGMAPAQEIVIWIVGKDTIVVGLGIHIN